MTNRYLIIYHEEDNDGVCSGAMAKHYLVDELGVDPGQIVTYGATYAKMDRLLANEFWLRDEDSPIVVDGKHINTNVLYNYTHVILTDISFNNFEGIEELYEKFENNFVWVDHHAPVILESVKRKLDDKIPGVRDTTRSAILNMYKYLYDPFDNNYLSGKVSESLRMLSAWDSWSYEREGIDFERCRVFNIGMSKLGHINLDWWFQHWDGIVSDEYQEEAFTLGQMWVDDLKEHWAVAMKKNAQYGFTVGGRSAALIFTESSTSSLCFESVKDIVQNGICVKTSSDGNIILSLYNTDNQHDFHCGRYCQEHFHGGGHEGAAGGKLTFDEFAELYKSKEF